MKIKARDIIPGWPKGRSTTASFDNHCWEYFDVWPKSCLHTDGMKEQMQLERLYHQMQQAMVNEYFAAYRLPPTKESIQLLEFCRLYAKVYNLFFRQCIIEGRKV
jgi:hypothetical protein